MNILSNLFGFCVQPRKKSPTNNPDKRARHQWDTLARTHGRDSKFTELVRTSGALPQDLFEKLTTCGITGQADSYKVMGMDQKTHRAYRREAQAKTGSSFFGDLAFWEPSAKKRERF